MLEDIAFVELYFEIESMMLDAEGIADTKSCLRSAGWWTSANLEEVFELLAVPIELGKMGGGETHISSLMELGSRQV